MQLSVKHLAGTALALALVGACWLAWRATQWLLSGTMLEDFALVGGALAMFALLWIADAVEHKLR